MREKLAALRRLGAVYEMVEKMYSIEARKAYGAVLEAQSAILAEEIELPAQSQRATAGVLPAVGHKG